MPQSFFNPHTNCGGRLYSITKPSDKIWTAQKCDKCGKVYRQKKRIKGKDYLVINMRDKLGKDLGRHSDRN